MKTPSSKWSVEGKPDPHGDYYKRPLAEIGGGHWTTLEIASKALSRGLFSVSGLTVLKERIRWLSRHVPDTEQRQDERAELPYGDRTDDELANEAFMYERISFITAAVMRMNWLQNCYDSEEAK